jgi:glycosyltransferase involved in cell wall biosynthesis
MRIALDVSPLLGTRAGVGTYVEQLVKSLLAISVEHQYDLYTPGPLPAGDTEAFEKYAHARIVQCPSVLMGWRARWGHVDVFHGMNYKLRGWGRRGGVVTIHDLAMDRIPQASRKLLGQHRSFQRTRRTALKATRVIAVSKHTAGDIAALYGVPPDRLRIIPNGAGGDFHPIVDHNALDTVMARYGISSQSFLLTTGGENPRKNVAGVIQAFAKLTDLRTRLKLVVVGGVDKNGADLRNLVARAGLQEAVVFAGHVSGESMRALYSACAAFVFASLYEGFGMPVLEAMACGAPVVCSNTSALPEVAGDAAALADPYDPGSIAIAIAKVLGDAGLRDELRRRGFLQARTFSWEQSARKLVQVYEELAGTG